MAELRFIVMVRREGESVHNSDKYATEEMEVDEIIDAMEDFVHSEINAEAERLEGENDAD